MNVLLRNIILSGGAPQSMLQYVRVLRSNKSNIKVIAQLSEPEIAITFLSKKSKGTFLPIERRT